MSPHRLTLVLIVLLGSAPLTLAQPSGREQLRGALEDYYAHVVAERLELSDSQAEKLRPKLDRLARARQEGMAAGRGVQRRLESALSAGSPDPEDLAALLAEFLDTEYDGHQALQAAREDLVSALEPRQQATFLVSEEAYRRAVMGHLRELRSQKRSDRGEERVDSPWRRPRDKREPQADPQGAPTEARLKDMRENLTLLLAYQLRNRAQVPLDRVVELLPELEAVVGAQLALARSERSAQSELRAALESDAPNGKLKRRVRALLEEQASLGLDLHSARRAIVEGLDPLPAARFVLLQDGFRKKGPQRLRMMQRLMSAEEGNRQGPQRRQRSR